MLKYFSHPDKCLSYNITFRTSYNLAFSLISWLTIAKTEPFLSCYFQTSRNRSDMKKIIITLWFIIIYFPFNYHHNHITLSPVKYWSRCYFRKQTYHYLWLFSGYGLVTKMNLNKKVLYLEHSNRRKPTLPPIKRYSICILP